MRTADVQGVVKGVEGVGLLVGRAEAVDVALEGAQVLVALNLVVACLAQASSVAEGARLSCGCIMPQQQGRNAGLRSIMAGAAHPERRSTAVMLRCRSG